MKAGDKVTFEYNHASYEGEVIEVFKDNETVHLKMIDDENRQFLVKRTDVHKE